MQPPFRALPCALLAAAACTAGAMLTLEARQVPVQQKVVVQPPALEVRDFSGEFGSWGKTASIGKGSSAVDFRWTTTRKNVAKAWAEISVQAFTSPFDEQTTGVLKRQDLPAPPAQGGASYFSVAFGPVISQVLGGPAPPAKLVLHVRVVMADGAGTSFLPTSNSVRVTYDPPTAGTKLEHSMTLRLKHVACIRQTSGPGQDDILVEVQRGPMFSAGPTESVFFHTEEDIPDDWKIEPGAVIETYTGLGLKLRSHLAVAVAEEDRGWHPYPTIALSTGPNPSTFLYAYTDRRCNKKTSHSCLGSPRLLAVTQSDWNKVALGGQTVTKVLRFAGEGALYEVTFELSPK